MGTLLSIGYIFMNSINNNRRILPRRVRRLRGKVFIFKKTGTLKINIFFESLQKPSFYIKEHLPKIKFKIRIC